MNDSPFIRVHEPDLGPAEAEALAQCIANGDASGNAPVVRAFEAAFAQAFDVPHALSVSSGSAALHLAFDAIGLGPGDEIIVPSFTFAPCADMATLLGATVVYADSCPHTFNITAASAARVITSRTRAILAVHMYGHAANLTALDALCQSRGLVLIEDCAQAIGARWQASNTARTHADADADADSTTDGSRPVGSVGSLACYSFYANKHITTGEGGMVTTHNPELAERVQHLRSHALTPADTRAYHRDRAAYNYRLPAFSAAVGHAQLKRLPDFLARRSQTTAHYHKHLANLPGVVLPPTADHCAHHSRWANTLLLTAQARLSAAELATALKARNIQTRPFYSPLHTHDAALLPEPGAPNSAARTPASLPQCEEFAPRGLVLPSGNTLTLQRAERVCRDLTELLS